MRFWLKVIWAAMLRMFVSPYYYILVAGVLVGGHSPTGKVVAIIGITVIMPILGVLYGKVIQDRKREG